MPVRTILAAVDGSDLADSALQFAIERAILHKAEIVVALVLDRPLAALGVDAIDSEAAAALTSAEASARARGVSVRCAKLDGAPAREILKLAHSIAADLIVVGSHGRGGLDGMAVGRTANEVLRGAAAPVFVVTPACERPSGTPALARALVAVDGSPGSHAAVTFSAELARVERSRLTLCNVVEPSSFRWTNAAAARSSQKNEPIEDASSSMPSARAPQRSGPPSIPSFASATRRPASRPRRKSSAPTASSSERTVERAFPVLSSAGRGGGASPQSHAGLRGSLGLGTRQVLTWRRARLRRRATRPPARRVLESNRRYAPSS